ncbi:MAG TPA: hypothetical protein VGO25_13800, partial [Rhodanobacteraceae bacterium]|jgi:hypothetical protein|nr:hypothetical protein [Rhodanobacteraceae bacterium]
MRTSLYSILCIVVRLGALLIAVETLIGLPLALESLRNSHNPAEFDNAMIGFYGAFFGLAAILWIYPGLLARLAAGQASKQVFESPLDAAEIQYIALCVLGVYFAFSGIFGLIEIGLRLLVTMRQSEPAYAALRAQDVARLVAVVAKIVIGIGLAFGARGLTGWVRRLREQGLPPPASLVESDSADSP